MAATDKPFRDQRALDMVFAVSNILMLLALVWMFWQDYAREYKSEQRAFRDVEVAMAQRAALDQIPETAEFDAAEKAVKDAKDKRKEKESDLDNARAELARLDPQRQRAEAAYQSITADVGSTVSLIGIALEHGKTDEAARLRDQLARQEKDQADKAAKRDEVVNKMKEERLKIDEIEGPYTKAVADFKKVNDKLDAMIKLAHAKTWGFGDRVRTLPVINGFADPLKIQQFTINDVPIDYNFKQVTRFDRCTSCHVGIDKPSFTVDRLKDLDTKANQQKLDEAIALYKRRVAVLDPSDARTIPNPADISLIRLDKSTLSPARIKEFAAHPRLDLFVGSASKHPTEKFGCSSCHAGQGSGTSFRDASHSPNNSTTRGDWTKDRHWEPDHMWDFPMLPTRFIESSCIKCHHEVTDLISSDNRVEAPKLIRGFNLIKENGCFGCHEISGWKGPNRVGPDLRLEPNPALEDLTPTERDRAVKDPDNRPGTLRKVGPALTRLSEKVTEDWVKKWLYSPSGFRPDTKMPHYFNLSTNNPEFLRTEDELYKDEPGRLKQEKFPNTEMASIAHFLMKNSGNYVKEAAKFRYDAGAQSADESAVTEILNKGRLEKADQDKLNEIKARVRFRNEMKTIDEINEKIDAAKGKADKAKGKTLFLERGCLSCHTHHGTEPTVTSVAAFGPSLSQVPAKLGKSEAAHKWLTRWIMDPQSHSPRSRMPVTHLTAEEAASVAAWLLDQKATDLGADWDKIEVTAPSKADLQDLVKVYLTRMLSRADIDLFLKGPQGGLAETVMLNDVTDEEKALFKNVNDEDSLKFYLGKKAVNRLGCFGCHDIPGFETTKSIGVGLNDWGKKPADRLAFEDIGNFFKTHYFPVDALTGNDGTKEQTVKINGKEEKVQMEPYERFYAESLLGHNPDRIGYLNQKVRDPRSYDYNRIRAWDDRARMPKFTLSRPRRHKDEEDDAYQKRIFKEEAQAREAVSTFVLGLTAEQVPTKSINQPSGDRLAEVKGRQILDKYNCGGCHLIRPGVYDYTNDAKAIEKLELAFKDQKKLLDDSGEIVFRNHVNWVGRNPVGGDRLTAYGVRPQLSKDPFNVDVQLEEQEYSYVTLRLSEALRFADGKNVHNVPASATIFIPLAALSSDPKKVQSQAAFDEAFGASAPFGGRFADLLTPYLIAKDPQKYLKNPDGDSSEARASLPPVLIGQGERTQPEWLYRFLLNPTKVRKMAILQMPKFNMSEDEARALAAYFAAVSRQTNPGIGLPYPYDAVPQRDDLDGPYWKKKTADYIAHLKKTKATDAKGKALTMSNYEARVAAYKPVWEELRKTQEKTLQEDIKKLESSIQSATKSKADKEKELTDAKGDAKKKLQDEIDALSNTLTTISADKQALDKTLKELDVATLQKNWEEKEAYAADGYRLLVSRELCLKCHQIGGASASEANKQGPPLDLASVRLRPDWIERWVDKPQRFVPYPSLMPPYFDKNKAQFQQLHSGPALEQIEALRDVLMNFPRVSSLPINRSYNPDQPAAK